MEALADTFSISAPPYKPGDDSARPSRADNLTQKSRNGADLGPFSWRAGPGDSCGRQLLLHGMPIYAGPERNAAVYPAAPQLAAQTAEQVGRGRAIRPDSLRL